MGLGKQKPFLVFLLILITLIILHYTKVIKPVERFLLYISRPVAGSFYNFSLKSREVFDNSQREDDFLETIERLQKEVASLTVLKSSYQEVMDENRRLKNLLNFVNDNNFDLILASVVAKKSSDQEGKDLIINKGSIDGLTNGLAVVNEQGILIGKIIEVKDSISKICLSINPGCEFAASIQNSDRTQGIVSGNLGLTIKMGYIPQLEKVYKDDIVITSGLGGRIPRGLVVGKIIEVKSENNEVWQEAIIEAPLDFNNLTIVSIVIP